MIVFGSLIILMSEGRFVTFSFTVQIMVAYVKKIFNGNKTFITTTFLLNTILKFLSEIDSLLRNASLFL